MRAGDPCHLIDGGDLVAIVEDHRPHALDSGEIVCVNTQVQYLSGLHRAIWFLESFFGRIEYDDCFFQNALLDLDHGSALHIEWMRKIAGEVPTVVDHAVLV